MIDKTEENKVDPWYVAKWISRLTEREFHNAFGSGIDYSEVFERYTPENAYECLIHPDTNFHIGDVITYETLEDISESYDYYILLDVRSDINNACVAYAMDQTGNIIFIDHLEKRGVKISQKVKYEYGYSLVNDIQKYLRRFVENYETDKEKD